MAFFCKAVRFSRCTGLAWVGVNTVRYSVTLSENNSVCSSNDGYWCDTAATAAPNADDGADCYGCQPDHGSVSAATTSLPDTDGNATGC